MFIPFQNHEPIFSPDGRYIWDPATRQWIRRPQKGCLGFVIGVVLAIIVYFLYFYFSHTNV